MNLSIMIPNYNGAGTIRGTLQSIFEQMPTGTEVLVVDDDSSDNSIDLIQTNFPGVVREIKIRTESRPKIPANLQGLVPHAIGVISHSV